MNIQKNNMTKKELKRELENIGTRANTLFKKDGVIAPVLLVYHILANENGNEKSSCAVCPVRDIKQRREILFLIGRLFLKEKRFKKVNAIAFISEAWVSVYKSNEDAKKNGNILPSQDPNRREVVNIIGMTDKRDFAMTSFEIKCRGDKEKRTLKISEDMNKMEKIESELLDSFWRGMGMIANVEKTP